MTMLTSTWQMKMEVLIIGIHLNARAHSLLYGVLCTSSRVCAGKSESASIVSCNETCHIDIRLIDG